MLARTSTSKEDAALFAELLSLPNDGRYPMLDLAPAQRRERILDALAAQIGKLTRQSPVLMRMLPPPLTECYIGDERTLLERRDPSLLISRRK